MITKKEAIALLHPDTTRQTIIQIEAEKGQAEVIKRINQACLIACEALEKQTPKKPSRTDGYPHRLYCTNCGWTFFYNENNKTEGMFSYCPECGQAIDWSEEE